VTSAIEPHFTLTMDVSGSELVSLAFEQDSKWGFGRCVWSWCGLCGKWEEVGSWKKYHKYVDSGEETVLVGGGTTYC
jgi:hypothetical protein